jgi:hypothetical protein
MAAPNEEVNAQDKRDRAAIIKMLRATGLSKREATRAAYNMMADWHDCTGIDKDGNEVELESGLL